MSLADGFPLCQVKEIAEPNIVFAQLMDIMIQLARRGLIHCDFNEFNILINEEGKITFIDFPQMVSASHENANM